MRPPCDEKCRQKCFSKIQDDQRRVIFEKYWGLQILARQRDFISKCMVQIQPTYRYQRPGSHRRLNNNFYFEVEEKRVRVCKKFFKATLDINDRPIRTVIAKNEMGFISKDFRGRHNKHKKLDASVKEGIKRHINTIPRIESHYLRSQTCREFIDGGKSIADLYRDYKTNCMEENTQCASLSLYTQIFNHQFNISFFTPKKDRCELCTAFDNASAEDKKSLQSKFDLHLKEKLLSRAETQTQS